MRVASRSAGAKQTLHSEMKGTSSMFMEPHIYKDLFIVYKLPSCLVNSFAVGMKQKDKAVKKTNFTLQKDNFFS